MKITLYSTGCPRCSVLEKKLAAVGISYDLCSDAAIMKEKEYIFLPVLEVDNNIYGFKEAVNWINTLKKEE